MNVVKSFILALHTQTIAIMIALIFNWMGVNPIAWLSGALWVRTLVLGLLLIPFYLIIALVEGRWIRTMTKWPFKSGWVGALLLSTYVLTFAWAIREPGVWRYFLLLHLPIGITFKSVLASEFTFPIQMLIGVSVLTPLVGLKLGYGLDAWFKRTRNPQKKRDPAKL